MLKVAKIVGINSDTSAALALSCQPDSPEAGKKPPSLFAVVYCQMEDAFSRAREALAEAESTFYTSSEPLPQRLTAVLEVINKTLSQSSEHQLLLAAVEERLVEEIEGAALYLLCQATDIKAWLLRQGEISELSSLAKSSELVSGFLKRGDRLIISTQNLQDILGEKFSSLHTSSLETLSEEVGEQLPQDQVCPVAAIVIEEKRQELEPLEVKEEKEPKPQKSLLAPLPGSRKALIIAVAVVVFLGVAGTLVLVKRQQEAQIQASFREKYQLANEELDKALAQKDADPKSAGESLDKAKIDLAAALKINPQSSEALALKKRIGEGSPEIRRVFQVDNIPLWLDLGLIKSGMMAKTLSLSLGKILILDPNQKVLVSLDIANKSHQILAGGEKLGTPTLSSLNGGLAWVFSQDKGVVRLDTESKVLNNPISKDEDWGNIIDVYGFANNLYLLDSVRNQIWKYMPVVSGLADKKPYLASGTKADFAGARRMQIDSSIWVLKPGGEILKYTQGVPDYFSLSGLDKPLGDVKTIFVSDKTENLYVLDSGNHRLVVLNKKGEYQAQYQSDRFGSIEDLVVDEQNKKTYLLEKNQIFQMELR